MRFATPAGLFAAALVAPLVLWYVLRPRRPKVDVASTYLWRRTERSVAAAVPWQRFRADRTFWLVAAAVLAGALALARPAVPSSTVLGDHTVLVLDTSLSMSADEDGPTRLELARRRARDLVDRAGPTRLVSVVEAGPRARVLVSATADSGALRRALDGARPSAGAADLADAFTLAASLQRPGESTITYLLTDGPVAEGDLALAPEATVVERVGTDRPNLAVSRLQAVPGAAGAQVFVAVRSFDQLPSEATVTVSLDGTQVHAETVRLPPRGSADILTDVAGPSGSEGVLTATVTGLTREGERPDDALAVDDTAYTVLAPARAVRVLVAGPGNVYIEQGFASVEGVEVVTAPQVPDDLSAVDLLVVDRVAAPPRPAVPTMYVAPSRPPTGVSVTGETELPVATAVDTDARLMADVDLAEAAVAAGQRVEAPTLTAVAGGASGPLLLTGRLEAVPVVYVAFDLLQSNLPLQVAWPVLVANTVAELAGPSAPPPLLAGGLASVPIAPAATGVVLTPPAGEPLRVDPAAAQVRLDAAGIWRVAYEAPGEEIGPALLAVNPDPAESDLARGAPEAGGPAAPTASGAPGTGLRVFGPGLLVLPLVLLLVEWITGRRRGTLAIRRRGAAT